MYAIPQEGVRTELLTPTAPPADAPKVRGTYYDLELDGETVRHAAWSWADAELDGYLGFRWDALEHWYEEDDEVYVHPRDPYHRVDVVHSSRHVEISLDGETVADTTRPVLLFETGLPVRYYIPAEDVASELLVDSDSHTQCPYKGEASYHGVRTAERLHKDVAWYYPDPLPGLELLPGTIAFYNERVELKVDGELQERPETPWSRKPAVGAGRAG